MRTLFSLMAALLLTFGLATAVSAQEDDASTDEAPAVTNEGDEETASAGDAAAADTEEGEVAVADDVVAVDTDDDGGDDNGGDDGGDDGAPAAPPTNLPTTGVGAFGGAGTGILAAIFGLFATASAAVSMRLRR